MNSITPNEYCQIEGRVESDQSPGKNRDSDRDGIVKKKLERATRIYRLLQVIL